MMAKSIMSDSFTINPLFINRILIHCQTTMNTFPNLDPFDLSMIVLVQKCWSVQRNTINKTFLLHWKSILLYNYSGIHSGQSFSRKCC